MKVIVTGGCGYKGSVLVPKLLARGHQVEVIDTQWFGVNLPSHPDLTLVQADIRRIAELKPADAIVHLAGIANDPCGELDARITWETNVLGTMRLAEAAKRAGIARFIFASSASVYGIREGRAVKEDDALEPVSDYNRTKMVAERVLRSYNNDFSLAMPRPATICGPSPRMRSDTLINAFVREARTKGTIHYHGGSHGPNLMRPHMHIEDVTDLYCWLVEHPEVQGTFNAASENQTIGETARLVAQATGATIHVEPSADKRSYCVDYSLLNGLGFVPKRSVNDAIEDLLAWEWPAREDQVNLEWMRRQGLLAV